MRDELVTVDIPGLRHIRLCMVADTRSRKDLAVDNHHNHDAEAGTVLDNREPFGVALAVEGEAEMGTAGGQVRSQMPVFQDSLAQVHKDCTMILVAGDFLAHEGCKVVLKVVVPRPDVDVAAAGVAEGEVELAEDTSEAAAERNHFPADPLEGTRRMTVVVFVTEVAVAEAPGHHSNLLAAVVPVFGCIAQPERHAPHFQFHRARFQAG